MNKQLKKSYNLSFHTTIKRWDEALPLGNGMIGCLIWGESNALRFSLDRGDIWDTTPYPGISDLSYQELVQLAKYRDVEKIRQKYDDPYNHPLPSKLPAGKLIFNFGSGNIKSELDIEQGQANLLIENEAEKIRVSSFLHAVKKVGFIKIDKPCSDYSFRLENPEFSVRKEGEKQQEIKTDSLNTGSLKLLSYPEPKVCRNNNMQYFIQKITEQFSYGIFVKCRQEKGSSVLAYYIATSNDGQNWIEDAQMLVSDSLDKGYETSLYTHLEWWENYWSKSGLSVPDELMERNWYLTNYLFGSCSRKGCYPMPLQGVWTADEGTLPPWKGDYHHDLNTQMSYYHYLKANHLEEGESFIDYLWELVPKAKEFAAGFYQARGLCLPSVMAIDGTALGGWPMYTLAPTNQIWLCQAFERHYRYTGDPTFLKEKVYPYFLEVGEFILSLLETDENGQLVLPVSSSPEIHDDTAQAWVTPNSNYDLSLMHYLFIQLLTFSKALGKGDGERWQAVLDKLPQLAVSEHQVLKLSPNEQLMESHRHFAHLMAIHPLRILDYNKEEHKKIIDACILDLEVLGTGYWVGFSFTWMAELYAIQKNGTGAAFQLRLFWEHICSQNGFNLNGDYRGVGISSFHYRPFTLETNMCAADALQEMLIQSENNELDFFPAVPKAWKEISFTNFRVEKGLLVSAVMEKGKIVSITLKPDFDCEIIIKNANRIRNLVENLEGEWREHDEVYWIKLMGKKEYHLGRF